MGHSRYSDADYTTRSSLRASTGTPTFKHDADIKAGIAASTVAKRLKPTGVKLRESRDSADKIKVPIILTLDTTGSMGAVPGVVQGKLPELMGGFLNDKASGKKYLGDNGYPDILISAVDDVYAQGPDGAVQLGQFESGMEIDDDITNLWITGNGGGNRGESYDLMLYFAARHTAHDHWDKRGQKGYLIILGDEPVFGKVEAAKVNEVFGPGTLQADIPIKQVIKEASERYHIFWGVPRGHEHGFISHWKDLFGDERVIVFDPEDVCKFIVGVVAMVESAVDVADLATDGVATGSLSKALAPLAGSAAVAKGVNLPNLPAVGSGGGRSRI